MDVASEKPAKPPQRWFRFSLRTLLIVVTVLAVPLGWVGWRLRQVRREQATIAWVVEIGGRVYFPSGASGAAGGERSWWVKNTAKWFGERAWGVHFRNKQVSDLSPLVELKNLKTLNFRDTQVSDLTPLAALESLNQLLIYNTQVSYEQVQELRQALPNCVIHHLFRIEN
jgi:hypothetical protein